ncbi:MAG: ABC transporter permease [Myxococcota bacterium]
MLFTIALHEFRASVLRASFVWMTLGMPILFVSYLGLVTGIGALSASEARRTGPPKPVAVVDEARLLGETEAFRTYPSVNVAEQALERGAISAFVVLPPDYIRDGELDLYSDQVDWWIATQPRRISRRIHEQLLRQSGIDPDLLDRTRGSAEVTQYQRSEDGSFIEVDQTLEIAAFAIPAGTTMGLIFALAMNASLLLASVVEDKENKMMDVLLSSARADDLLFGKVLGIVGAGLLQIGVWTIMTMPIGLIALATTVDTSALWTLVSIPRLLLALAFGVFSFLFYGVMLVGLGSFGSSFRDSQQLAAVVIMLPMIPLIASPLFLSNANGIVPRILSFFPPTCAPAMMLRVAIDDIAAWEIGSSLLVLLASIVIAVRGAAKLFRVGTLLYGKRPSIRRLWDALVEPM